MRPLVVTAQAPGAWLNGSTVRKINSRPDDGTPDGTPGVVLGSLDVREQGKPAAYAYWIEWANRPGLPVACIDTNDDGTPRLEFMGGTR